MKRSFFILTLLSILLPIGPYSPTAAAKSDDKPKTEIYLAPKQGKYRLAYCYSPNEGCGEKAAKAWCEAKGFKGAKEWKVQHQDHGKVKASRYIGSDGSCKTRDCDIFESITCRMGPPTFF